MIYFKTVSLTESNQWANSFAHQKENSCNKERRITAGSQHFQDDRIHQFLDLPYFSQIYLFFIWSWWPPSSWNLSQIESFGQIIVTWVLLGSRSFSSVDEVASWICIVHFSDMVKKAIILSKCSPAHGQNLNVFYLCLNT